MAEVFLNTLKFGYAEGANTAIYFFKKIPFIGKKIPDSLYSHSSAKQIIGIIAFIFSFLFEFVKKSTYVVLFCVLPSMFIKNVAEVNIDTKSTQVFMFFVLSFIIGSASRAITMQSDKSAFNMIILLRTNPQQYYLSQIIYRAVSQIIFFLPVMGIIMGGILEPLVLLIELAAFRFIFEAFLLLIYDKKAVLISENNWFMGILWTLGMAAAYGLPFLNINNSRELYVLNPIFIAVSIILGSASLMYLCRYKKYKVVAKIFLTLQKIIQIETMMENSKSADVAVDSKKISVEDMDSSRFNDKTGYDYLNSIFFARHKRVMQNSVKIRTYIILAIGVILIGLALFLSKIRSDMADTILTSMPYFVFIMYTVSVTEKVCRAMFFNCDKSLLKYGYYKQPGVILSNFKVRLKKIVTLNLIPGAVICILLMAIYVVCTGSIYSVVSVLPNCLGIMFLSVFFSVHYLFMYYVLQPYTEKMDVKSPVFSIVNGAMYFACYGCLQIRTSSLYFTSGIIIGTFIYVIAAVAGVYKLAPKTFKLRQ